MPARTGGLHRWGRLLVGALGLWAGLQAPAAVAAPAVLADEPPATLASLGEPVAVSVPSLDRPGGAAVMLPGLWWPVALPEGGTRPAVVLLHGCGGAFDAQGRLAVRQRDAVSLLNRLGVHALVLDSLAPRGERELCTQRAGERKLTVAHRRRDALGALQWLAAQPGVDAARLGLMGWSHGGSTTLAAINLRQSEVRAAPIRAAFAVAFYPGCVDEGRRGFAASGPLLMLLGDLDDWTPPSPCQDLAEAAAEPRPVVKRYAEAYHGFDGAPPVRLRRDVPNGVNPGQGVHLGGHPPSRAAARQDLMAFLVAQGLVR